MKQANQESHPKKVMLTEVEKLDGKYPGLAFTVKSWFDMGIPTAEIPARLEARYGVTITDKMADGFRTLRWIPEKEKFAEKMATTKCAIEAFGGDVGVDAVILSKLWEMMDKMTIAQLIAVRTLFIKIRAQNLKEQEFLYKTGQWKPPHAGGDVPDPETQQRNVLRRIKEIFGLAGHEEEEERETAQLPAAVEVCEPKT